MTIAADMCSALTALARARAALAMDPACRSHVAVLGACLDALEDCRERAEALERAAIPAPAPATLSLPPHMCRQGDPTALALASGRVVSLDAARARRAAMREALL
jgi:hypothetical protein